MAPLAPDAGKVSVEGEEARRGHRRRQQLLRLVVQQLEEGVSNGELHMC